MKFESHLIRKTSLQRLSVFMLFSILICCVSSILSSFNSEVDNCQKNQNQSAFSNKFSDKCSGVIAQNGIECLSADVEGNLQLGFAGQTTKRSTDNELHKSLLSFDLSNFESGYYSPFSFELKLQEKFNRNTVKGNIGISERFQV